MSHYDTSVPKVIAEDARMLKYRRRILSPRRMETAPSMRRLTVGSNLAIGAVGAYLVLYADWGQGENCFTGFRKLVDEKKKQFFTLTEEDERELRARGDFSTPLLKAASPSEPSTSLFSSFTSWFSSSSSATPATGPTTPVPAANPNDTPAKPKCKPCCACPETRKKRDECVITFGEEKCEDLIKAHQDCMRAQGFNI